MSDENAEEYNFKVLVVGEVAVGKTSIIRRYTEGGFNSSYSPTLGADFGLRVVRWNSKSTINLQLWDVAGHERYGQLTRVYYKCAMGAFIVYDLSRPNTWTTVVKWYKDLIQNVVTENGKPIPVVLLANKCDINGVGYDDSYLDAFCDDHGLEGWLPVSAKMNKNIDKAMDLIISQILSKKPPKEKIRPGSPWFRAQSPAPTSPVTVLTEEDGKCELVNPGTTEAQHKSCSC